MNKENVLILGSSHIASRVKLLVTQKGFKVTHLIDLNPNSDSSIINETKKKMDELEVNSFSITYVLFEKDEDNLEIIISMMALYPDIPMATSLFNENLRPHLENAYKKLIILNPAKLAAPFFVEALDKTFKISRKSKLKTVPTKSRKTAKNSFLLLLIGFFSIIIFSCVVFFHFSDNLSWLDSLYFVVVTVATVGYGDINLLNSNSTSKVVGIGLILSSTIFIWLIFSLLIDGIIKKRTQKLLGRKKYNYKEHIILCGLGRLGYYIAEELQKSGEKLVIIETNQESPSIEYFRNQKIDVYIGDARQPDVLSDVGIDNCRALVSVINDDFTNLEIGLNARYFKPDLRLVLRIFDETMADIIKQKFDIHLTKSMSYIAAEKFSSLI